MIPSQHNGATFNFGGGSGGVDPNKGKCKATPCAPGKGMCKLNPSTKKWGCACAQGWGGATCSKVVAKCSSVHSSCQKPASLGCASGVFDIQLPGKPKQKMFCWMDGKTGWTLVWQLF